MVSTQDFHSCNTSSILVGSTNNIGNFHIVNIYVVNILYWYLIFKVILLYGRDDVGEVFWSHSSVGRAIHF